MLVSDEKMITLAGEYWSMNPDGQWTFRTPDLAKRFGILHSKLHTYVASICAATNPGLMCNGCNELHALASRTMFETRLRDSKYKPGKDGTDLFNLCRDCRKRARLQKHAEVMAQQQEEDKKINDWIEAKSIAFQPKSYANASPLHAFLIDGLLRHAGDAWRGDQLDSWATYRPRLCPLMDDTVGVYQYLYSHGWIIPHINSPLDAFWMGADGAIEFDWLLVRWSLADDVNGTNHSEIIDVTESLLREARSDQLFEVWRWVCIRELHGHFDYIYNRFSFIGDGWSDQVEHQLNTLLQVCSLAQAKTIILFSISDLTRAKNDKEHKAPSVYKMIPHAFMRKFNFLVSKGTEITILKRHPDRNSREAVYTAHLFDFVFDAGDEPFYDLTGVQLKELHEHAERVWPGCVRYLNTA